MNPPTARPGQTIGIREAAEAFGVSHDTLRRRIKDGKLPEADLVPGRHGDTYVLPMADLMQIADREGWVLDLTDEGLHMQAQGTAVDVDELLNRVIDAEGRLGQLPAMERERDQAQRERDQARSDLENERTERSRLETELAELNKTKAVAEALADERKNELERERSAVVEYQEQLETERELAAETAASHAAELVSMGDRATQLEKESADRLSEAQKLKESMGWWSRRRYEKGG